MRIEQEVLNVIGKKINKSAANKTFPLFSFKKSVPTNLWCSETKKKLIDRPMKETSADFFLPPSASSFALESRETRRAKEEMWFVLLLLLPVELQPEELFSPPPLPQRDPPENPAQADIPKANFFVSFCFAFSLSQLMT